MSAYSAQSYYAQGPATSAAATTNTTAAYAQSAQVYATGSPGINAQPSTADPQTQAAQQQLQQQSQHTQSPQPQHQAYYYHNPAYSQQPAAPQQPNQQQQQQPGGYYNAAVPAATATSPMYMNGYPAATPSTAGSQVAGEMAYSSAPAYPHQYQYAQQAQQQAQQPQPYQTAYLNSYPSLQPYQYLQQQQQQAQQQQQQQALYQQQYQQHAYHQQPVAMMPTITDPTGQKPPLNIKPKITTTLWEDEGTLCFQVEARGICVARREDNNMINGTKLLNVAGMTRGRRDGILKGEKSRHVVKAGAMHLKGVWIPYERALDFANREKIIDLLYPLFVTDLKALLYHPANFARTAQVLSAAEKRKAEFQKANEAAAAASAAAASSTDDQKKTSSKPSSPKDQKKTTTDASSPPSQQSLSGRFSVDRIVSNNSPTPSVTAPNVAPAASSASTPPASTSSTTTANPATSKPYYYGAPGGAAPVADQYGSLAGQPPSAYISPTSRISTPVSAAQQQPSDMLPQPHTYGGIQRYASGPTSTPSYAIPQVASYSQMYHPQQQQQGPSGETDTRVPLVSPVSSTNGGNSGGGGGGTSTPTSSDPHQNVHHHPHHAQVLNAAAGEYPAAPNTPISESAHSASGVGNNAGEEDKQQQQQQPRPDSPQKDQGQEYEN